MFHLKECLSCGELYNLETCCMPHTGMCEDCIHAGKTPVKAPQPTRGFIERSEVIQRVASIADKIFRIVVK